MDVDDETRKRLRQEEENQDEENHDNDENSEENSRQKRVTATKVGNCDVVLRMIFRYMSIPEILSFRTVNGKWNSLAISTLNKRSNFSFRSAKDNEPFDLANMSSFLSSIKNFLCTNFEVNDNASLKSQASQQFLDDHGKDCVKKLKIKKHDHRYLDIIFCRNLLFNQATNITELTLCTNVSFSKKNKSLEDPQHSPLLKLKKLFFYVCPYNDQNKNYPQLLEDVLKASPNLQNFVGHGHMWLQCVPTFVATEKIRTIKKLDYLPSSSSTIDSYDLLAQSGCQLEILASINFSQVFYRPQLYSRAVTTLNKILESSKESLREIKNMDQIVMTQEDENGQNVQVKFPILPNLMDLGLSDQTQWRYYITGKSQRSKSYSYFPHSIDLSKHFPSVSTLDLSVADVAHLHWDSFLPSTNGIMKWLKVKPFIMESVEWLTINCNVEEQYEADLNQVISKCSKYFPNVMLLNIQSLKLSQLAEALRNIWKCYPYLDSLDLGITVEETFLYQDEESKRELMASLDSAITGLPKEFCMELLDSELNLDELEPKDKEEQIVKINEKRIHPSFVDLHGLDAIHFKFFYSKKYDFCDDIDEEKKLDWEKKVLEEIPAKIFTRVSAEYGFHLMHWVHVHFILMSKDLEKSFLDMKNSPQVIMETTD